MESKTKNTNIIPFIILAIIVLAVCVIYFVGFGGYLNSAAAASGLTLGLPMVLYYLYLYGGIFCENFCVGHFLTRNARKRRLLWEFSTGFQLHVY